MLGQLNLSLVPSQHNGYEVSCFGFKDGSIDLTVSGGTAPYTYRWSTGATTEDVGNLPAGFYAVTVTDANQLNGRGEITLNEPDNMKADLQPYEYGNGYNISLFNAYNGSIDLTVFGGVAPFTYSWSDGAATEDRTALGSDNYAVVITDANGCVFKSDAVYLRQPDRSDWTMTGNAGTNPAMHFFGSTDNQDVVFKSNGIESLRLLPNGSLKLAGLATAGNCHLLYVDADGILKKAGGTDEPVCTTLPWYLGGNINVDNTNNRIGTNVPYDLLVVTDADEKMRVTVDGKVGIGTIPPDGPIEQYRLFVEDGIVTRDVLAKVGPWPDYVFKEGYHLLAFDEWRKFIRGNGHLPGMPSAAEVEKKGGIELADSHTRLVKVVEEQALYILQLEEQFREFERQLKVLELNQR